MVCADNEILCVSSAKIVLKVKFHPESKGFTSFVYFIIFSVYLHQKRYKIATNNTYFTKISFAIIHYGCMGFFLSKIQTTNFFLIIIVVYKITLKFCCLKIHFSYAYGFCVRNVLCCSLSYTTSISCCLCLRDGSYQETELLNGLFIYLFILFDTYMK